jgi:mRNA interferase RelE/StbE
LAWTINFADVVEKQLSQFSHNERKRIRDFLVKRVANLENPRSIGEALKDKRFSGLWRYRVGDYRIICNINDKEIYILVVGIGHRSKVYK